MTPDGKRTPRVELRINNIWVDTSQLVYGISHGKSNQLQKSPIEFKINSDWENNLFTGLVIFIEDFTNAGLPLPVFSDLGHTVNPIPEGNVQEIEFGKSLVL